MFHNWTPMFSPLGNGWAVGGGENDVQLVGVIAEGHPGQQQPPGKKKS